jgi:hypothetical protein
MPEGPRCAAWARAEGVEPIGTAGSYAGFLLVEWPRPWPKDIGDVPELAPVVAACTAADVRLQGLVPRFADRDARRAILYRRPDPVWFAGYERVERIVPADPLVDTAVSLASTGDGDLEWARATVTDDVLVCTHGKRDVCCGSQGTVLANELSSNPARFGGTVRVWRTSHTGGHRFAPTGIVLPQGTVWAYLDADAVRRVVARHGPLDDLLSRYRGCSGVGPAAVQALERAAFGEIGWEWLEWRRRGSVDDRGVVRLEAISPSGEHVSWTGHAVAGRALPVPLCGQPLDAAEKTEVEIGVEAVARVAS